MSLKICNKILLIVLFVFMANIIDAQITIGNEKLDIDYASPVEYEIGGIKVEGTQFLDENVLSMLSGMMVGEKIEIPGDKISNAIDKLWKQGFFSDIKISYYKISGKFIFLTIKVEEKPRLSRFKFEGLKKSEIDNIREKINISRGDVVTDDLVMKTKNLVDGYFIAKGFLNVDVEIHEFPDSTELGSVVLKISVKKNNKIKINKITFSDNNSIEDIALKRVMKETKEKKIYRLFSTSKYLENKYEEDKASIISKYNESGYRNARIISDSVYKYDKKTVDINITVTEGEKFFFRDINWVGNTKYSSEVLSKVLDIKKGEVYNQQLLERNLFMNMESTDVSSLYLDDGYLFFNITPVEVLVENDSIDVELRIHEGKQARINKVTVIGNNKTNDHVIMREIRTKPGQLFSRSDIIRTQRELAQLRYFDQEKLDINTVPNPVDGTVDLEYVVEETSSDQIELSGGWGAGRVIGTLGLSFNNFSSRKLFDNDAWRPLPAGDGQKVSIRAQSNGIYYRSYSASFVEPWLGGKKPNALSVSVYNSLQNMSGLPKNHENRRSVDIIGLSVGLGQRLKWPDDFFTFHTSVNFQHYKLKNYSLAPSFTNGYSNNLNLSCVLGRNSIDAPIYPRKGSELSLSAQSTFPYSMFSDKDYTSLSSQEKFKWTEYYKIKFNTSWMTRITKNLVLNTRTKFGFLGMYSADLGLVPFERFYVGGDGLSGYALDGREVVALRGYDTDELTPGFNTGRPTGGAIFNKYTVELRYPVSLNPMATIYVLGFAEAGNCWLDFKDFEPFNVRRSAGVGLRIFLPMFGLLGLDYGFGLDPVNPIPGSKIKGQFHFSIGQSIE